MFDTILRGGTVIDGTGRPAFPADVGITGGTITAVGDLSAAAAGRTMDVAGRIVTPGFIDIHRHADAAAFRPDYGSLELRQGLTTIVNGNCGLSAAPFGSDHAAAIRAYLRPHRLPLIGDGALQRDLWVFLFQLQHNLGCVHVHTLGHAGDEVRHTLFLNHPDNQGPEFFFQSGTPPIGFRVEKPQG